MQVLVGILERDWLGCCCQATSPKSKGGTGWESHGVSGE